ncbi:MAG: hypothetical protein JO128_12945 [Alphaproteobacteria bacterium]|nr:hypothetical protein [Alphaproteobacteria bacterium]
MEAFSHWLEATSLSQTIQNAIWLIDLLQTIHILCVGLVLSSVVMLAARIAALPRTRDQTLAETARRYLPWFWTAFAVLAVTGILLVIGEPRRTLVDNPAFRTKLVLLTVAVVAGLLFHVSLGHQAALWDDGSDRLALRRLLALAGGLLFGAIVIAGRWIAYLGPMD